MLLMSQLIIFLNQLSLGMSKLTLKMNQPRFYLNQPDPGETDDGNDFDLTWFSPIPTSLPQARRGWPIRHGLPAGADANPGLMDLKPVGIYILSGA